MPIFSQQYEKKKENEEKHIYVRCCDISAVVLTCFRLTKDRAMYFQPETIVVNYLHFMVLLSKVLLIHS